VRGKERWEITLGAFVLLTAAVIVILAVRLGGLGTEQRYRITAMFDDASGLVRDADVTIAGVKVGNVAELDVEGGRAKITLALRQTTAVRANDIATIRLRSLLGDKYIEIEPGDANAPLLTDGGRLISTKGTVEIDRFLAQLQPLVNDLQPESQDEDSPMITTLRRVDRLTGLLEQSLDGREQDIAALLVNLSALLQQVETSGAAEPEKIRELTAGLTEAMSSLDNLLDRQRANIDNIARDLAAISGPVAEVAPDLAANLNTLLRGLAPIAVRLEDAAGQTKQLVDRAEQLLSRWEAITAGLEQGNGTAGKLLQDDALYDEALALVRDLRRQPWRLLRKGKATADSEDVK